MKMTNLKGLIEMLERKGHIKNSIELSYPTDETRKRISYGETPIELERSPKGRGLYSDQTIDNYLESGDYALFKIDRKYNYITGISGFCKNVRSKSLVLVGPGKNPDLRQTKLVEHQKMGYWNSNDFKEEDIPEIENEELKVHHSGLVEVKYQIKGAKLSKNYELELRAL